MAKRTDIPASTAPAPQVKTSAATSIPVISMVLGVVSLATFMWFLGIPALVLGIIGVKKYSENRGLSITGLVTGIISTVLMVLAMIFFIAMITIGILNADSSDYYNESSDPYSSREDREDRQYYRDIQENI